MSERKVSECKGIKTEKYKVCLWEMMNYGRNDGCRDLEPPKMFMGFIKVFLEIYKS